MVKNVVLGFASVALAVASAASGYTVTFYEPVTINGAQLKAGDYKLELKDDKTAVIKQGKSVTEVPVKIETEKQKFARNAVRLNGSQVQEIRLGGTDKLVVFENSGSNATN
jgi:hypothetical protein